MSAIDGGICLLDQLPDATAQGMLFCYLREDMLLMATILSIARHNGSGLLKLVGKRAILELSVGYCILPAVNQVTVY